MAKKADVFARPGNLQVSRRAMLAGSMATLGALTASRVAAQDNAPIVFDTHVHVTTANQLRYPAHSISEKGVPNPFDDPLTAERYMADMKANGVAGALIVQRAHVYGYDNHYVTDSIQPYRDVLAAVCSIDATSPWAPSEIRHWIDEHGAVGLRIASPEPGSGSEWISNGFALKTWDCLAERDSVVRVHMFEPDRSAVVPVLHSIVKRHPKLRIVVDHAANTNPVAGKDFGVDRLLTDLMQHPHIALMGSPLNFNKAVNGGLILEDYLPRLVRLFGADRLMWGSDFGNGAQPYAERMAMTRKAVSGLSGSDARAFLGETAFRFYGRPLGVR